MHARLQPIRKVSLPRWVNDTDSGLNRTSVTRVFEPRWVGDVADAVLQARRRGESLAIAGGRHAMGGQQFLSGGTLLDVRQLRHMRWFDRGRALLEGAPRLRMHGQDVSVRAQVEVIDGLSAHADQAELMRWLSGFRRAPEQTYIVHGEAGPAQSLATLISERLGWNAEVAVDGATVPLT